jgi:PAS domain S-box-containing protein
MEIDELIAELMKKDRLVAELEKYRSGHTSAEAARLESEEKLRRVLENSWDEIYQYNLVENKFDYISPASEAVLGYTPKELMAMTQAGTISIVHPEDRESLIGRFDVMMGKSSVTAIPTAEYRVLHKKLGVRWVRDNVSMIFNKEGTAIALVGILSDITEYKRAEEAIQESEEKYRLLAENTSDVIYSIDPSGIITYISPQIERYGFKQEEIISKNFIEFIFPEDRERVVHDFEETFATGEFIVTQWRALDKSGNVVWFEDRGTLKRDASGNITTQIGVMRDITEQKRSEELLQLQRKLWESLSQTSNLETAMDLILDAALKIESVDCGGIYLVDESTGALEFTCQRGLSDEFVERSRYYDADSPNTRLIMQGKPIFSAYRDVLPSTKDPIREKEGILGIGIIPVIFKNRVIAAVNLASRSRPEFDTATQNAIESFAGSLGDALARVRAENQLAESEKKFRELADLLPLIVYEIDMRGNLTFVNKEGLRITGKTPEDLEKGWNFSDILVPEDYERAKEVMQARLSGKDTGPVQYTARGKDGSTFPVLVHSAPIVRDGKLDGLRGVVFDIADRQRALDAVKKSEELYRTLVDTQPDALISTDLKADIIFASKQAAILHGYDSPQEMLGLNALEMVAPADRERASANLKKVLNGTRNLGERTEYALLRRDESSFLAEVSVNTIRDVEGKPEAFMAVIRDITEQRQAEQALAESNERFRNLFQESNDAIFIHVGETILDANSKACEMMRMSREQLLALPIPKLHPESEYETSMRAFETIRRDGHVTFESRFRRSDDSLVDVEISASIIDQEKNQIHGIVRDVTERNELQRQLLQSQKMEAVGRLAGGIAHDFNNILGAIMGYCDVISRGQDTAEKVRKEVGLVRKAADRAAMLTRQLLAFSRGQVLEPKVLNINYIISDMEIMLRRIIGEDIELLTDIESGIGNIKVDPGQLEQVILNLVVNARDAMPDGGRISIDTREVDFGETYAGPHLIHEARTYAMLVVSDTGCGMDKEMQSRIFEPFYTSKEKWIGTGLGLSTVYGIVKQSRGDIWVESEPETGSTFTVCFPIVDEELKPASERPGVAALPGGSETVLIVEDEDDLRNALSLMLADFGYTVLQARDGIEASSIIERHDGAIDLLVTDMVMPKMNGRELVDKLSAEFPDLKVIYMSGYVDGAATNNAEFVSEKLFLQKPFTSDVLLHKVREVLDSAGDPGAR